MSSDYHLMLFVVKYVDNYCLYHLCFQLKLQVLQKVLTTLVDMAIPSLKFLLHTVLFSFCLSEGLSSLK